MRIAVFSDTHGNPIALEAVLEDIAAAGGVDAHWFVGDAAMIGIDPVATVQRLAALPGLVSVRGNGDRRVATDPVTVRAISEAVIAESEPEEASIWRQVLNDSEWTRDGLRAAGLYEWVADLPVEARLTLPDGTRVLLVHASPGTDEGPGIHAAMTDGELRTVLARVEADLVFVGHTHQSLDRTVDGVRVVNLGSVSNPPRADKRATWTLLEAGDNGYALTHRQAEYDLGAVLDQIERDAVPAGAYLQRYFRTGVD